MRSIWVGLPAMRVRRARSGARERRSRAARSLRRFRSRARSPRACQKAQAKRSRTVSLLSDSKASRSRGVIVASTLVSQDDQRSFNRGCGFSRASAAELTRAQSATSSVLPKRTIRSRRTIGCSSFALFITLRSCCTGGLPRWPCRSGAKLRPTGRGTKHLARPSRQFRGKSLAQGNASRCYPMKGTADLGCWFLSDFTRESSPSAALGDSVRRVDPLSRTAVSSRGAAS